MPKFSASSYSILKEYFDILNTSRTGTDNSYLLGKRRTIVSEGGGSDVILYQKIETGELVGHRFLIQSITDNNFKFQYRGQESSYSGATGLTVGEEMYFRKDSYFHVWLRQNTAYQNFVNTNKTFIYFGRIYSVSNESTNYNIVFEGLKDFAIDALPEHNQTDKIKELFKIFFDASYHDIYNMTKTLWSFFDAKEVNLNHLNYLATRAGIETDKDKIAELPLREFVDNLPYWLKRKGTYTAYYIIYKLLLENTTNKLNIYERWVEWCLKSWRQNDTYINESDFENHHILEYYGIQPSGGAGIYYDRYDPVDYPVHTDEAPDCSLDPSPSGYLVMSPHYKVEIDLSSEPFGDDYIIDEDTAKELLRYWEYIKPVSKFVHYHMLLSPVGKIDVNNESVSLYDSKLTAVCDTRFTVEPVGASAENPHIVYDDLYDDTQEFTTETSYSTWTIENDHHSPELLIQTYDSDGNIIYPQSTNFLDKDTLQIDWFGSVRGSAFLAGKKLQGTLGTAYYNTSGSSAWEISHANSPDGVVYQVYTGITEPAPSAWRIHDIDRLVPDVATSVTDNTLRLNFSDSVSGAAFIRNADYFYTQDTASSIWNINHNLNITGAIVQCWDHESERIYPENIQKISSNIHKITFSEPVSGYATFVAFEREFTETDVGTVGYWKIGTGADDNFNPVLANDVNTQSASGELTSFTDVNTLSSDDDLVCYLPLEKGEGTIAFDESGNDNYGIIGGATTWVNGPIGGNALNFTGSTSDKITISSVTGLPNTAITVSCWVYINSMENYHNFVNHEWAAQTPASWMLYGSSTSVIFGLWPLTGQLGTGVVQDISGAWHHLAGTYDGSNIKIYIDGDLKNTDIVSSYTLDTIGDVVVAGDAFTKKMDDIRIYNRALTPAEISEVYNFSSIGGHHLIEFNVPKQGEQTLNEIGVFDTDLNMTYYTRCSNLYKPDNVQLDIVYRIKKQQTGE